MGPKSQRQINDNERKDIPIIQLPQFPKYVTQVNVAQPSRDRIPNSKKKNKCARSDTVSALKTQEPQDNIGVPNKQATSINDHPPQHVAKKGCGAKSTNHMQAVSPTRFVMLTDEEDDRSQPMEMSKKDDDSQLVGQDDMVQETFLGDQSATQNHQVWYHAFQNALN